MCAHKLSIRLKYKILREITREKRRILNNNLKKKHIERSLKLNATNKESK